MDPVSALSLGVGLYGAYKGHQARDDIQESLEEQSETLQKGLQQQCSRCEEGSAAGDGPAQGGGADTPSPAKELGKGGNVDTTA